jgi:hypothetical protein
MTCVKIGEKRYPASIRGYLRDTEWNNRDSKAITLEMTHEEAVATFVDDLEWSIVYQGETYTNENGETVTPEPVEYDNSEWCVAGSITDNRNGTVTVKMGKMTAEEMLAELMGVLGE